MPTIIRSKFDYGQIVYVKTDLQQDPRQVIGIQGTADGGMLVKLTIDGDVSWHYECELTEEKNTLLAINS